MNYIAHCLLSFHHNEIMVGNFLADMISNKEMQGLPIRFQKGIIFHRWLDTMTDRHPLVRKGYTYLRQEHHKYSPVVLDVLFDYILYKEWDRFITLPFHSFEDQVYHVIANHLSDYPMHIQKRVQSMINHRFLIHYTHPAGLKEVFSRLKYRSSFDNSLEKGFDSYLIHQEELHQVFLAFFPEMIDASKEWIRLSLQNGKTG